MQERRNPEDGKRRGGLFLPIQFSRDRSSPELHAKSGDGDDGGGGSHVKLSRVLWTGPHARDTGQDRHSTAQNQGQQP